MTANLSSEDLPPSVAGTSLSGNTSYVIAAEENRALCQSCGVAPAADGTAHPIYFFVATHVGMGMTIGQMCAACDFDVNQGPMIVSSKVEYARPLRVGEPYGVRGDIRSLTRKPSRKLGTIDLLDYRLSLVAADGTLVLVSSNVWVLPRRAHP